MKVTRSCLRRTVLVAWWLGTTSAAAAQRLPVEPGDLARVAAADSAALGLWRVGRVLWVTRQTLFMVPVDGEDSLGVPLNGSVRLAVARPSPRHALLWGAAGLVAGAALGATVLSSAFDGETLAHGRAMETMAFGSAGALIGMVTAMAAGPRRWREILVSSDGIAGAQRTRPGRGRTQFGRRSFWTSFPTTEEDFTSFFAAHRDSLAALEGVWEILGVRRGAITQRRVAIVRDQRYEGFDYVVVSLPRPGATFPGGRGSVLWALRPNTSGTYDARGAGGGVDVRVEPFEGELILTRQDGSQEKWLKVYPVGLP